MSSPSFLVWFICLVCPLTLLLAVPVLYQQTILNFKPEHHYQSSKSYPENKNRQDNINISYHPNDPLFLMTSVSLKFLEIKKYLLNSFLLASTASRITCKMCEITVGLIHDLMMKNASTEDIKSAVRKVCVTFDIETPRVCEGLIEEFAPEFLTVLANTELSSTEFCSFVLGPECTDPYHPSDNWSISFPSVPQPPPVYPSPPKPGSPTLRFLHLTDIHFDAAYREGSNADCTEPLCCRDDSNTPGSKRAGKFGDYTKCDTPLWTLENMFSTLSSKADSFDYIIWTGDLPPHNVWNQSSADQLTTLKVIVSLFLKYFPNKLVFPSLGNHESSPVNSFPPPYITNNNSISWLYNALADQWKQWLPLQAQDTIRRGAYYAVSPFPGLRIISLNMNYCNNQNWWMLLNSTDPANELQWLVYVLQSAENDGVKVHILGHIPPGVADCLKTWSWNYYKIISRYQNNISGQFFGHTHFDSFSVFYDVETLKIPVSVAYIAPSVTPYTELNMGYRIYTIDGNYTNSSFQVLDHETYFLNLSRANMESKITWEFEYSAKAAYNMTNLYPRDWENLIQTMSENNQILELYNLFYTKSRNSGKCDTLCRKLRLCEMRSGRSHDPTLCKQLGIKNEIDLNILLQYQPRHC